LMRSIPGQLFAFHCSTKVFKSVKKQFHENGLQPKVHGNVQAAARSQGFHAATVSEVKTFIQNYAEQFGLVLPGRVASFNNADLMILPSFSTKVHLYRQYENACKVAGTILVSETYFRRVWHRLLPNIVVQKPRTDLCAKCQLNFTSLGQLRTLDDEVKEKLLKRSVDHLSDVTRERSLYQSDVLAAKTSLHTHPSLSTDTLSPHEPNSQEVMLHYSFDYAQQIQMPHDSQQVGPLYFLAPYKVGLFGVSCEAAAKMVIYAIPEIAVVKGSNSVISFLHHFLTTRGYGEKTVHLRADNCTGQNKNRYMMAYLCWRVLCGMHTKITLSFMPVGHTKFYPDLGFGIFKRHFRLSTVSTMEEVGRCIEESSPISHMLIPELVGNERGELFVQTFDWQHKFADVKAVPQLKKFHHFVFDAQHPGAVKCTASSADGEAVSFTICRADQLTGEMPDKLSSLGLSQQRQEYLYSKIRQFCPDHAKDILCPAPPADSLTNAATADSSKQKQPSGSKEQPAATSKGPLASTSQVGVAAADDLTELIPATRKPPTCSYCKSTGHRNAVRNGMFTCPTRRQANEDNE